MYAELEILKLRDEIAKLKKKHFVEVTTLKAKIEQQTSEKHSIQKELERVNKPKINLSVSKKYEFSFTFLCFKITIDITTATN